MRGLLVSKKEKHLRFSFDAVGFKGKKGIAYHCKRRTLAGFLLILLKGRTWMILAFHVKGEPCDGNF